MVEDVPVGDYQIPLGTARIAQQGSDITLVGWGQLVAVLEAAVRDQPFRQCTLQISVQPSSGCTPSFFA